ncbi:transporter [Marivirga tractuosa]|uniref:Outer membrane efflux protein n=1 Tax=Marivirga tractuosa (strain ATCC 23168 / DSM 4126 / NBRC 15989 / NCIMB 1408 / VKM B-1430 / H-43) TaxID=643867 RepID=E4TUA1_MARTH|nr:TolC family protein [Marivirga tractuosa]ADR21029.1 outer membrane efflux protein [Marivirga tractuosa DSM 4126]BDD14516.1 transporter [Marivirga tractuosa]
MLRIFIVFIFLTIGLNAHGQDKWSLQKCVDYALENNLQVKQSGLDVESAEISLFGSKMSTLPNMNGNLGLNTSTGRSIDPFTNTIIDRGINSQNAGLNASLPLFDGGQRYNSIKRDQFGQLAAEKDLESVQNDVTLNVVTFYTNILFNKELLETAKLRLLTTESQENRVEKQVEIGALAQADLLQIRQQKANDELEVVRAENNLEISYLQLKQALQIPADQEFDIEIPELPEPNEGELMESSSNVYQYALQNQPVIKAAEFRKESAMRGIGVARSGYYPSLSLNAGISTNYSSAAPDRFPVLGSENVTIPQEIGYVPLPNGERQPVFDDVTVPSESAENTYWNQLDFNQRRFVGLSLNIPIFNRFQVKNNVQQSIINHKRSEYQLTSAKNQLQQTIEQAYLDVKAAAKSYQALKNSYEAAELSFRNAEQRLELGATDAVEFTQIKNDFERVKSDLIRAKYDYIFKLKVLDFYQGKPLNF